MNTMYYFGTNLDEHGHYIWKVEGENLQEKSLNFHLFPFDPEGLIDRKQSPRKGAINFFQIEGWKIMRIEGSCKDERPGTKTVFMVKENLTDAQMMQLVLSNPIAYKIISAIK